MSKDLRVCDRVKICESAKDSAVPSNEIGKIGIITFIDRARNTVHVRTEWFQHIYKDDNRKGWVLDPNDVQVVKEPRK